VALAAAVAAAAYFPLNVPRGSPQTLLGSFEEGLPVVPVLAVPYLLILPVFWAIVIRGLVAPGYDERGRRSFRVFVAASLIVFVVSDLVFLVFPTVVPRPAEVGGIMAGLLRWIYENDNRFNDLPSGHAAMATLLFLHARSFRTRARRWAAWSLATLALVATLLLRQHSVLGAAAGVVLALFAWWVAWWIQRRRSG
jgi:membrane-associated phospholipid phosphatase